MMENIKNILNKKHLLIIGKSEIERQHFIGQLIENTNFETFRFPAKMKLFDEYIDFIKKEQLYRPWYAKRTYNVNQVLDFHWDWIAENNSLVVMEEFDIMEERWRIELLRIYLNEVENHKKGETFIHLIISQEKEGGLIELLSEVIDINENERRTKRQVVEQNLDVIDLENL